MTSLFIKYSTRRILPSLLRASRGRDDGSPNAELEEGLFRVRIESACSCLLSSSRNN